MLITQVSALGLLLVGISFSILILTIWMLATKCNINGPLKYLVILSLVSNLNGLIEAVVTIYTFMASLNLNDLYPLFVSNIIQWFLMAACINIISVKKIGAVYSKTFTPNKINAALIFVIMFSFIEFIIYLHVMIVTNWNAITMTKAYEYAYGVKPWMMTHFVVTSAISTLSFLVLYNAAEIKSFKAMFEIQYVNKFQISVFDIFISLFLMAISITIKAIQLATGWLPLDVYVDTLLLNWLLYVHLYQLSDKNSTTSSQKPTTATSDSKGKPNGIVYSSAGETA